MTSGLGNILAEGRPQIMNRDKDQTLNDQMINTQFISCTPPVVLSVFVSILQQNERKMIVFDGCSVMVFAHNGFLEIWGHKIGSGSGHVNNRHRAIIWPKIGLSAQIPA